MRGLIRKKKRRKPVTSARRRPVIPLGDPGGSVAGGGSFSRGASAGQAGPSVTLALTGTVDQLQQRSCLRHHAPAKSCVDGGAARRHRAAPSGISSTSPARHSSQSGLQGSGGERRRDERPTWTSWHVAEEGLSHAPAPRRRGHTNTKSEAMEVDLCFCLRTCSRSRTAFKKTGQRECE